jgi:hypothetical protein
VALSQLIGARSCAEADESAAKHANTRTMMRVSEYRDMAGSREEETIMFGLYTLVEHSPECKREFAHISLPNDEILKFPLSRHEH